jgi:hypothetical protein
MKLTKEQLLMIVEPERIRQEVTGIDAWYLVALSTVESGRIVGRISRRQTNPKNAYTAEEVGKYGIPAECQRRAGGLFQITPVAWQSYRNATHDLTSPMMLFDPTDSGAKFQIRVGVWAFGRALESVDARHPVIRATLGTENHAAWADAIYARGGGAIDGAIGRVLALGLPATLTRVLLALPDNGENTELHGRTVAATARAYRAGTSPPSP